MTILEKLENWFHLWKFWSKIEVHVKQNIFVKNRSSCQKKQILVKNPNFGQNRYFGQTIFCIHFLFRNFKNFRDIILNIINTTENLRRIRFFLFWLIGHFWTKQIYHKLMIIWTKPITRKILKIKSIFGKTSKNFFWISLKFQRLIIFLKPCFKPQFKIVVNISPYIYLKTLNF